MSAHPPFEPSTTAPNLGVPAGLMLETGECYIVRRSPGCGCCPQEAVYYGPWLEPEEAALFATYHTDHGDMRHRNWTVCKVPYEVAGRWIILKDHYATSNPWGDRSDPSLTWDKTLEEFEQIYSYV